MEGQPLDRAPWKAWSELREAVVGRQLFTSLDPLLFLVNKVGLGLGFRIYHKP